MTDQVRYASAPILKDYSIGTSNLAYQMYDNCNDNKTLQKKNCWITYHGIISCMPLRVSTASFMRSGVSRDIQSWQNLVLSIAKYDIELNEFQC